MLVFSIDRGCCEGVGCGRVAFCLRYKKRAYLHFEIRASFFSFLLNQLFANRSKSRVLICEKGSGLWFVIDHGNVTRLAGTITRYR